eukprot:TRINITY_DN13265_c0_g1_i2.p1 TRINITY_DN13265_c0_g1~~TRINITY_DN13265_c0_g1_i2.p1  ORF type:complete len:415 (-),score=55.78 TRINITY_DN13265_c0_g1_i2:594-1838(-)
MYWSMSRINHSCAPNTVIVSARGKLSLKVLRNIGAGEEVSISYLGQELLYPTEQRQWLLWRSKCFVCKCARCASKCDPLRARPCRTCTTRGNIRWKVVNKPGVWCRQTPSTKAQARGFKKQGTIVHTTGEETVTEEGQWVKCQDEEEIIWILVHGEKLGLGQLICPDSDAGANHQPSLGMLSKQYKFLRGDNGEHFVYDQQCLSSLRLPNAVILSSAGCQDDVYMQFGDGRWHCSKCGSTEDSSKLLAAEKLLSQLVQRSFTISMSEHQRVDTNDQTITIVKDAWIIQALQLADDILEVCGPRHWAWNWSLLLAVDLSLSMIKYTNSNVANSNDFRENMMMHLLEIWHWLGSLDMSHDPAFFLFSRAEKAVERCSNMTHSKYWKELHQLVENDKPPATGLALREFIPESQMQVS